MNDSPGILLQQRQAVRRQLRLVVPYAHRCRSSVCVQRYQPNSVTTTCTECAENVYRQSSRARERTTTTTVDALCLYWYHIDYHHALLTLHNYRKHRLSSALENRDDIHGVHAGYWLHMWTPVSPRKRVRGDQVRREGSLL